MHIGQLVTAYQTVMKIWRLSSLHLSPNVDVIKYEYFHVSKMLLMKYYIIMYNSFQVHNNFMNTLIRVNIFTFSIIKKIKKWVQNYF